ncbi:unnamed protein product [Prunus armeniaca]
MQLVRTTTCQCHVVVPYYCIISPNAAFGQSSSSPFASQPVFGQTSNTSNNPFVPKPFGSTTPFGAQTGSSIFGGTSTGVFGAAQSYSPFGNTTPAFGAASSPGFNSSPSPFGGSSGFGQKPVFGAFGSNTTQPSPFGSTTQPSQPAFGSGIFGSTTPFGGSSQPAFGATSTPPAFGTTSSPAFGATTNPVFGATSTPAFGATNTPAFGATSTPAFGATSTHSAFGATSSPAFGSTTSPTFGSTGSAFGVSNSSVFGSTGAFGASSTPAFGSSGSTFSTSRNPGFGASSAPGFGSSSTPSFTFTSAPAFGLSNSTFGSASSPFGAQSSPFGAQPTTLGSNAFRHSAFEGQQCGGSRVAAYAETPEPDGSWWATAAKLESMSAMPVYKDKSHEELRWEDYQLGDKGGPAPAGGSGFGMSTSQPNPLNTAPSFPQASTSPFNSATSSSLFATKIPFSLFATKIPFSLFATKIPFFSSTGFGTSSTPFSSSSFGSSSTPSFSFSSAPAFGQSNSTFGSASSPFGAQSSPFGTQPTTLGNNAFRQSAFGGQQRGGSRVAAYADTPEPDGGLGCTAVKLESISAMPVYKDKNHEELRWEDYQLGDKGGPAPAGESGFGMSTSQPNPLNTAPSFPQASTSPFNSATSSSLFATKIPFFSSTGFGTSSTPFSSSSFGSSSTPSFSFSSAPAFGQSNSTFGSASSPFGAQSSPFGTQPTTLVNNAFRQSAFGGQQRQVSRVAAYANTPEPDGGLGCTAAKLESISAMPVYKDKSHEELRWEDYQLGDKGGPAPAGGSGFGMSTSQPNPLNAAPSFPQASTSPFNTATSSSLFATKTPSFSSTGFGTSSTPFSSSSFWFSASSVIFTPSSSHSSPSLFSSSTPSTFSALAQTSNSTFSTELFNSTAPVAQTGFTFRLSTTSVGSGYGFCISSTLASTERRRRRR